MAVSYAGSLYAGPERSPSTARYYSGAMGSTSTGDFAIFAMGRVTDLYSGSDPGKGVGSTTFYNVGSNGALTTGSAGNDCYLRIIPRNSAAGLPVGRVSARIASGGSGNTATGTSILDPGDTVLVVFQSNGGTMELWTCKPGAAAVLESSAARNSTFATAKNLGTWRWGSTGTWAGPHTYQMAGVAYQAFSATDMANIANGADMEGIVSAANRKALWLFDTNAATINTQTGWGTTALTQTGDWSANAVGSPLVPSTGAAAIRATNPLPMHGSPGIDGPTGQTRKFTGTYSGFTPSTFQVRVETADAASSDVVAWADMPSFTASGGNWNGTTPAIPPGGPYRYFLRDKADPTKILRTSLPFYMCPVSVGIGQSPHVIFMTNYPGAEPLTGKGFQMSPAVMSAGSAPSVSSATASTTGGTLPAGSYYYSATAVDTAGRESLVQFVGSVVGATTTGSTSSVSVVISAPAIDTTQVASFNIYRSTSFDADGQLVANVAVALTSGTQTWVDNGSATPGAFPPTTDQMQSIGRQLVPMDSTNVAAGLTRAVNAFNDATGLPVIVVQAAQVGTSDSSWAARRNPMWPRLLSALSFLRPQKAILSWLNGAAEGGTSDIRGAHDSILSHLDSDITTGLGVSYRYRMLPHNRSGGATYVGGSATGSTAGRTRQEQYGWATSHPQAGSKVLIGPWWADMALETESAGLAQAATSSTITLSSADDGTNNRVGNFIVIRSGTGAGQVRTMTAFNKTTKVATISPAWTTIPDTTSGYATYDTFEHPNYAGQLNFGARYGVDLAFNHGYGSISGRGPVPLSVSYPPGGDGTVLDVTFQHRHGSNLRTPNGGTTARQVAGFKVTDGPASTTPGTIGNYTWLPVVDATITGPATVRLTLAKAPTGGAANARVSYGMWAPAEVEAWDINGHTSPALPSTLVDRGVFAASTAYAAGDVFRSANKGDHHVYLVTASHTSGTAIDLTKARPIGGGLGDLLYDDSGVAPTSGLPSYFTAADMTPAVGSGSTGPSGVLAASGFFS